MPIKEPSWWYGPADSRFAKLLDPVGRVWSRFAVRRTEQPSYRSSLPVICVGNFTAGGTGKTPLALLIGRMLAERGERPAYLTRGYGGRIRGPHLVSAGLDTASDVGDEPLLLARRGPVMIAADRKQGALALERAAGLAPPTVIVMDDGLQNPALAKDLTIAVVDGRRGVGNGRIIPAGPLRAPLEVQFKLADAVVVNRPRGGPAAECQQVLTAMREAFGGPVLEATIEPAAGVREAVAGRRLLAIAGIANPRRFFDLAAELGADVVRTRAFPDHHAFTEPEAAALLAEAARLDASVVTTDKDWVRLVGCGGARGDLSQQALVLGIEMTFEARDLIRLASLIDGALTARQRDVRP